MKYDHAVKYKGVYYPTGTDVPVGVEENKVEKTQVETKFEEPKKETTKSKSKK